VEQSDRLTHGVEHAVQQGTPGKHDGIGGTVASQYVHDHALDLRAGIRRPIGQETYAFDPVELGIRVELASMEQNVHYIQPLHPPIEGTPTRVFGGVARSLIFGLQVHVRIRHGLRETTGVVQVPGEEQGA